MLFKCVELVVLPSNLVWDTALPGLNLVEMLLALVVPTFTNIDRALLLVDTLRPPTGISGKEHHEALGKDLVDMMISVLSGLHNFVCVKFLLSPVNGLFRAIIPAGVDPDLPFMVLPRTEDLPNGWFVRIIRVDDVDPIACAISS